MTCNNPFVFVLSHLTMGTQMEEDESGWVFDSLVCFLNGAVWNAPLESFIEEKSLIFEPNDGENPDYRKVYDDFKNLVDFMLGNFMEDIGITPLQFEEACAKGTQGGISLRFDQNIFEQIWAANDYEIFKRMMIQKNVELQLQALELIEQKYGITSELFMPHREEPHQSTRTKEETKQKSSSVLEKAVMNEVIKQFPKLENKSESVDLEKDVEYLLKDRQNLEENLKKSVDSKIVAEVKIAKPKVAEKQDKVEELFKKFTKEENASKASDEVGAKPKLPPTQVHTEDIKKRQEYLRAQRDKLVAMKKEARKKQLLVEEVATETNKARPKSAQKAAESILEGNDASMVDSQQLLIRKALAEKLKFEVVGNK